jgi:hypothetical protein
MAFGIDDAVAAVASIGGKLIDRLWPDPAQAAAAKIELLKMQQTGELASLTADTDLMKAQLAVNTEEAKNGSVFVSGWRPFVGWASAIVLVYGTVVPPTATWIAALSGHPVPFPTFDIGTLLTILLPLLGIGGMRTVERLNGVAISSVKKG